MTLTLCSVWSFDCLVDILPNGSYLTQCHDLTSPTSLVFFPYFALILNARTTYQNDNKQTMSQCAYTNLMSNIFSDAYKLGLDDMVIIMCNPVMKKL